MPWFENEPQQQTLQQRQQIGCTERVATTALLGWHIGKGVDCPLNTVTWLMQWQHVMCVLRATAKGVQGQPPEFPTNEGLAN